MKRMLLLTLAMPLFLCFDAQAQTGSRLTAQANWNHNGATFIQNDSTVYNYGSIYRGGDLTHTLKHDNSTTWLYVGYTSFQNQYQSLQEFDSKNNLTATTSLYWSGTSWILNGKTLYGYDSKNRIINTIMQTWGGAAWVNVSEDVNTYNDSNKLGTIYHLSWNSRTSTFDSTSGTDCMYDLLNNNLISVSDYAITDSGRSYTDSYAYTYTSTNQVSTITFSTNTTGTIFGYLNNRMITNSYDSSFNRTTQLSQRWDAGMGLWVNDSMHLYTSFVNKMPRNEIIQLWDNTRTGSWMNKMNFSYTYNSFNQLTTSIGESWNVGGFWEFAAGDPKANYYYGLFTNVTSVKTIVSNNGDASIYPVPSQNVLHIDVKWNEAQAATVAIYDMAGRVVMQWDAPYGTEYNSAISIGSFAAGNYVVKINGAQGQIVKQIVVAH